MKKCVSMLGWSIACGITSLSSGDVAHAQHANAPAEVKALVVRIPVRLADQEPSLGGSGVVVGVDSAWIYIVTARHVLDERGQVSDVWVRMFGQSDSVAAERLPYAKPGYDIAVLRVRRRGWHSPPFDRAGDFAQINVRDEVTPMGCAQGTRCWEPPVPADRVVATGLTTSSEASAVASEVVSFQSSAFLGKGASGGALFNEWWEVVAIVLSHEPPRGLAIAIDEVLKLLRDWGVPVSLVRPRVPRAGYRTQVGANMFVPIGAENDVNASETRLPSGRLTLTRRTHSSVTWHASVLRLAPDNLLVLAGTAGVGLTLRAARLSAHPFIDLGAGRTIARFDRGGYYVSTSGGDHYVPVWAKTRADGLGLGGGADIEYVLTPHAAIELMAARWSFALPESAPDMPSLYVGGGLRWLF